MAKPIAATPVLRGKAAIKFLKKAEKCTEETKKAVPTPRVKDVVDKILADAGIR